MAPPPPLQPPLPATMAADLPHKVPHEPPAASASASSTASPSRSRPISASGTASPSRHRPLPASGTASPSRRRFASTASSPDASYIQGLIGELVTMFHRWQQVPKNTTEYVHLTEDLLTGCYRIEWTLAESEKAIATAPRNPAYYQLDELELSRQRQWIGCARYEVGVIRSAVENEMRKSAMLVNQDLMGTDSINRYSSQDNDAYIALKSDMHLLNMRQQDDQIPCVPLDEKATMESMKIISTAVLTMIAALSTYSAEIVAPLAHWRVMRELLSISPYVCITVALSGVGFSFCASKSNGLAECATIAVLLACLFVIGLGASAAAVMLDITHQSALLLNNVLMIALLFSWGWLFTNPRYLKIFMRRLYWECFDRRRSTDPLRAPYADPGSGQHIEQKGFRKMISNCFAACRRAFVPLNEDTTLDILKTVSPSALTAISALSLWAAHVVAPRAYDSVTLQRFLYTLPYVYLPLGVATIVLSVSASKFNGLASLASTLGLVLCACGVALGACCCIVLLQFKPLLSGIVAAVLVVAVMVAWGWMLSYPKVLNFIIRKTCCLYCARRLRIVPLGRFDGCGLNTWAWIFTSLKIIVWNVVVLVPSIYFAICSRTARRWWAAFRARFPVADLDPEAGAADLDPEAGAAGLEMTNIPVGLTR